MLIGGGGALMGSCWGGGASRLLLIRSLDSRAHKPPNTCSISDHPVWSFIIQAVIYSAWSLFPNTALTCRNICSKLGVLSLLGTCHPWWQARDKRGVRMGGKSAVKQVLPFRLLKENSEQIFRNKNIFLPLYILFIVKINVFINNNIT